MATDKNKASAKAKTGMVFGSNREPGTAGPDATYISDGLKRWRLRGDGVLGKKKK